MTQVKLSTLLLDNRISAAFFCLFSLGFPRIACSVEKLKDLQFLLIFFFLFSSDIFISTFSLFRQFHLADSTSKSSCIP